MTYQSPTWRAQLLAKRLEHGFVVGVEDDRLRLGLGLVVAEVEDQVVVVRGAVVEVAEVEVELDVVSRRGVRQAEIDLDLGLVLADVVAGCVVVGH